MKIASRILCLACALCLCLMLAACGGTQQSTQQQSMQQEAAPAAAAGKTEAPAQPETGAAEEPAPTAEPEAAPAAAGTSFVGSWLVYAQEAHGPGGQTYTHEQIQESNKQGMDLIVTFKADGTYQIYFLGDLDESTWTDNGDGTGSIDWDGSIYPMSLKDGFLLVDMPEQLCIFEPSERTAAEPAG